MEAAALGLRVEGVEGIDRASSSLDRLTRSADSAEQASRELGGESRKTGKALEDAAKSGERSTAAMDRLSRAAKIAGGILAASFSVRQIQVYADTWSDLTSRIQVSIGPQQDAAVVMERLGNIARMTYSNLEATADSFARNSVTLRALGKSTNEMLNYTEALNNALVVSGAKAHAFEMVQNGLSRAMAEGTLKAQELDLVLNYGSRVTELLADELGVNINQLRKLASDGKITGDVIYSSLVKNMELLAEQAESMPATIGDAFTLMRNAVLQSIGVYDQQNGLSESLAENLVKVADAIRDTNWSPYIEAITTAAKVTGAFVVALYAVPALQGAWTFALAAKAAALKLFTAQVVAATGALGLMQKSLLIVAAAFAGWQIGTYLRNQFEIVEKAGIALMSGIHQMAIQLGGYFERMGEGIMFALTNPLDMFRNKLADLLQTLTGLGQGTLRALGLDGFADAIGSSIEGIRSKTGEEHKAMLEQMRKDTDAEAAAVSDIYADMFADVGRSSQAAADATDNLNEKTKVLTDNTGKLSDVQKSIIKDIQALEQAINTWGMSADEVMLYTLALRGASDQQMLQAATAWRTVDALNAQADAQRRAREEQASINTEAMGIAESLLSDEERIIASYERRRQIVLDNTQVTGEAQTELLLRLEEERNEALIEATGSYWERWLLAAEDNLSNFDELSKTVVDSFTTQFGSAFEDMIFNAESVGDAVQGMAQGMVRAVVNAIGQMIAQELAYQAILALRGTVATAAAATEVAAIGATTAAATAATATTTTTQVAAATTTAAAWTPAAFMASIGSFGAAAAIGIAAVLAVGALGGFRKGGYTGNGGLDDVAGVVHGKEFVFDAASTAAIGVDNLESMRSGRAIPSNVIPFPTQAAAPASAGGPPIVNVYNTDNTRAEVSATQDEQGRDVIDIVVRNLLTDGEIADAVGRITGTQFQGA